MIIQKLAFPLLTFSQDNKINQNCQQCHRKRNIQFLLKFSIILFDTKNYKLTKIKKMFNRLTLVAQSNLIFRCLNCKNILFRQADIDEFISYDIRNLGKLQSYQSYKVYQKDLSLFVLQPEILISSLQINYKENLLTNYHPFLKMYMFQISCKQCKAHLGFQVQTVNENTVWMKDRLIIDVNQLSCLFQNKEMITKVIRNLQSRLVKKLKQVQNDNIKNLQKKKQEQVIKKLEQQLSKNQEPIKTNFKIQQKQMKMISLLSTVNNTNNFISKFSMIPGSSFQSFASKTEGNSYLMQQTNGQVYNEMTEKLDGTNFNINPLKNMSDLFKKLKPHQKLEMEQNLNILKDNILKQSKYLNSYDNIKRILDNIDKLSLLCLKTQKRIGSQLVTLQKLLTFIRHKIIKPLQQIS